MRIHKPETPYENMMFVALVKKLKRNYTPPKKSQRDERRQWNRDHPNVQIPMRPTLGKASLYTHQQHRYITCDELSTGFHEVSFVNERKEING